MDSDEAARHVSNISGWVSRNGHFYGKDERAARYDGCTHRVCEDCGTPVPKTGFTVCTPCHEKRDIERYEKRERRPYEGGMVYSDRQDRYFDSLADALEYAEDEGLEPADLRLLLCTPNYVTPLDGDYCCDELPEDGDVPPEVANAIQAFNEAVKGIVLSWSPSKSAVEL